ncbi:MAG: cobalamin-binding protein [Hydrogenophilus sp.]|nr:cobalamin-binding protein [Hydrogenophilus sp.]
MKFWRVGVVAGGLGGMAAPGGSGGSIEVHDDTGRAVRLERPATRIVSLAPHTTENLFAAGAGNRVVAAVEFSDYPPEANHLPRVGGYSRIDLERVLAVKPDLVVAWASGNPEWTLARLEALGVTVFRSEPRRLEDVASNLERLGRLAGSEEVGAAAAARFRAGVAALRAQYGGERPVRVFYQIWDRPLRTLGGTHIFQEVVTICGGVNIFGSLSAPAPVVSMEAVIAANPEVIVAGGMEEERPDWLENWRGWQGIEAVAKGRLVHISPSLLQRPTPRLLEGAEQLCRVLEEARGSSEERERGREKTQG